MIYNDNIQFDLYCHSHACFIMQRDMSTKKIKINLGLKSGHLSYAYRNAVDYII